jgi:ACS family sodium-dependent inorganic phosphate cotransporter
MLAWMPTYFTDSLSLDLSTAARVSLLPPVAAIAASALAGPSADALIARGVPVVAVRKAAQSIAFLGPAGCLLAASLMEGSSASVGEEEGGGGVAPAPAVLHSHSMPS